MRICNPIEPFFEGAPAALHLEFSPVCLGFAAFRTSEATPTSIGHLVASSEFHLEFSPMWRGCEGDPCCAYTRGRDGHFIDNSKFVWRARVSASRAGI